MRESFQSWGRVHRRGGRLLSAPASHGSIALPAEPSFLPVGLGRSYGDVCLNSKGTLLPMTGMDRILESDWEQGILRVQGGCPLGQLTRTALQHGWFPPVLPGTQHVTAGGAIANDVHGKNHHRLGTFGHHVNRLWLQRSDREGLLDCSPGQQEDLFRASIGGLGLTGIIHSAEIQLKRVSSSFIDVEFLPFDSLEAFAGLTEASDRDWEYTVAWVDLVSASANRLPGIFMRGNHASGEGCDVPSASSSSMFRWPFEMPFCPFNRLTCGMFNRLYRWRQLLRKGSFRQQYSSFFHPLDVIDDWNKLYGPKGFYQYQCVIPQETGLDPFREIVAVLRRSGTSVPLAVLKQTGNMDPAGLMSFPLPGWTLAMDFPNRGEHSLSLCRDLDHVVKAAKGRLYPAKDATMGSSFFKASYPAWSRLESLRDPLIASDFWNRVTMPID